ncbi:hypothetical protein AAFF_G00226680 [Aldrovandia affinis]|uniref:Uncharacterized protein n=1 Tax=Aldrovandia affinis TaxID=143900 RepID=A0AAD7X2F5_9TELE|nr:hypothetical protein AAFF_G00226680 [Aldrovandia affinis]
MKQLSAHSLSSVIVTQRVRVHATPEPPLDVAPLPCGTEAEPTHSSRLCPLHPPGPSARTLRAAAAASSRPPGTPALARPAGRQSRAGLRQSPPGWPRFKAHVWKISSGGRRGQTRTPANGGGLKNACDRDSSWELGLRAANVDEAIPT